MPSPSVENALLLNSLASSPETLPLVTAIGKARRIHSEWEARIAKATAEYDALHRKYQEVLGQHSQIVEGIRQKQAEMLVVTNDLETARKEFERLGREVTKRKAELKKLELE
jgi:hypothetical protein